MKKLVATKSNDDNLYGKCLGYLLMMLEVKRGFDEDYYKEMFLGRGEFTKF